MISNKMKFQKNIEFFSVEIHNKKEVNITPFYCEPCDKYFCRNDVHRNHNKTFSHNKRLERINILKEAKKITLLHAQFP